MRPVYALLAPDQEVYSRQRQTRRGVHRPDNGNPTHWMPALEWGNFWAVCAARLTIHASLIHLSAASAPRHGSVPARSLAAFFTTVRVLTNPFGLFQW